MRTTRNNANDAKPTVRESEQCAGDPPAHEPQGTATLQTITPNASGRLAAFGVHPLPPRGGVVSNELINQLRDEEGV